MSWEVHFFKSNSNSDYFQKFIKTLDPFTVAKIMRSIDLLEKYGKSLSMPHAKKIDKDIFELRIRGKVEIRVLYCFFNSKVVVLHIFIKKTQKLPKNELVVAKMRFNSL